MLQGGSGTCTQHGGGGRAALPEGGMEEGGAAPDIGGGGMVPSAGARWHADPLEGSRKTGGDAAVAPREGGEGRRRSAPSHCAHPGRGAAGASAQARGRAACAAAISAAEAGGCMSRSNPSSDQKFFCNRIQLPCVRGHPPSLILCPPLPILILISPALSISLSPPIRISHPPPPPASPPRENVGIRPLRAAPLTGDMPGSVSGVSCPQRVRRLLPVPSRRPPLPWALPSAEPRMAGGARGRRQRGAAVSSGPRQDCYARTGHRRARRLAGAWSCGGRAAAAGAGEGCARR
ncbi:hypothetical protein PVAP13_5KG576307 [Panicum virgatum]|uniref:Uncharacterized protein n=1 Tax=Panicum virgatum TaxID=38727 RepID=A0A8T0SRB7_PANVG|nr:hypothetical protein PVAP13_5KG576307 [Panicum virgatum]